MNDQPRILIVDDEQSMCELLEADLSLRGYHVDWRTRAESGFELLMNTPYDVVLTDLKMPGIDGIEFCRRIVSNLSDMPVVVMTAFGSLDTAVAAIRAGAYDFITKPFDTDVLVLTLERAAKHHQLQQQVKTLHDALERTERLDDLIGASPVMQTLFDQLRRIADTDATVLIHGESGVGKELVAHSLHQQSRRHDQPFVAVNCAALAENLLESELFGHKRGAFTDAREDRKGLFLQAQGGTLFLDEIGEIPLATQPKLLRVLEEAQVRPVGGDESFPLDVRLVTATNRDLETAVEEGRFREDLYFRVNVIQIDVPPLRSRGTDTLILAQHFLRQFAARSEQPITSLSDGVAERLLSYNWPGNVRELRNVMERAVALARHDQLVLEDLPEKIRVYRPQEVVIGSQDPGELAPLEEIERRYIEHVLSVVEGNKTKAAKILGLDRKTLYRKLKSDSE